MCPNDMPNRGHFTFIVMHSFVNEFLQTVTTSTYVLPMLSSRPAIALNAPCIHEFLISPILSCATHHIFKHPRYVFVRSRNNGRGGLAVYQRVPLQFFFNFFSENCIAILREFPFERNKKLTKITHVSSPRRISMMPRGWICVGTGSRWEVISL